MLKYSTLVVLCALLLCSCHSQKSQDEVVAMSLSDGLKLQNDTLVAVLENKLQRVYTKRGQEELFEQLELTLEQCRKTENDLSGLDNLTTQQRVAIDEFKEGNKRLVILLEKEKSYYLGRFTDENQVHNKQE